MIRGNDGVRIGMADWLKEFADYWKEAETRLQEKNATSYMSEIQRVLNGKRTVDDVVHDLRDRVGLDLVNIKKESEKEEAKTAAMEVPSILKGDEKLVNFIVNKIKNEPFTSFEAIKSDLGYPPELDDPEVEEFAQKMIKEERGGQEPEEQESYNIDYVDTQDNKYVDYDQRDTVNKI